MLRTLKQPLPVAGVQLPSADELDLRNNAKVQPLPAASVAADTTAAKRSSAAIDATRAETVQRMTAPQGIPAAELDARRMGPLAAATTSPGATSAAKSNLIEFNTAPDKPTLNASTSRGAAGPTVTQMNQPGIDLRNAQYAERAAYEAAQARAANPRSMTVKELFSRGQGPAVATNPMKFAPAVPQSAANAAANAAASAPPAAAAPASVPPAATGVGAAARQGVSAAGNLLRNNGAAIGAGAAAIPGQLNVGQVLADPRASASDVVQQQGTEFGRLASQGLGMALGGFIGSGVGPVGTAVGGAGGAALGGKAYDMFERGAKELLGVEAGTPLERLAAQDRAAAVTASNAASAPRSPNQTAATAQRTGLRLDTRSEMPAAADPRRLDMDPSRASLGASRDFTNELSGRPSGKLPGLPSDLRQGVVHKTVDAQGRVTYSGRNVGVNGDGETQMVDGTGRTLRMLNGNNNNFARSVGADGKPDGPMVAPGMTSLRGGADSGVSAALSAAAARGDMDAVRGYYAGKGESFGAGGQRGGDGGGIDQTSLLRLATSPGKVGGSWARQMLRDQMGDQTARRKQDMDMEIAMAPSRLAAQQRQMAATIFKQAGGDNARAGALAMSLGMDPKTYHDALAVQNTARASEQSVAEKFRENGKKEFQVFTDGKLDEQASGQMFDAARRLFPKIESADEGTRNAAMADAKELTGIFQKARSQDKVGFDALRFWEPKRAELSGMPDAAGGRVETLSGLGGMVTLGASNGDTTLTKNGKTVNLGRLNQRQLELLKTAQQSNWGN